MLRPGMWCIDSSGRVGLFQLVRDEDGQPLLDRRPEFHLVDDKGSTVLVIPADIGSLKQARFDQIPEKRRPPQPIATKFGYA